MRPLGELPSFAGPTEDLMRSEDEPSFAFQATEGTFPIGKGGGAGRNRTGA